MKRYLACMFLSLAPATLAAAASFDQQVAPLLQKYCQRCHGPQEQNGGLRIDKLTSDFSVRETPQPGSKCAT